MKRYFAMFVATLALSASLAACGGGDSGLDREDLITQADQICQKMDQQRQAEVTEFLGGSPKESDLVGFIKSKAVPAYRKELSQLKALEPGGDSREQWNELIAKLDQGISDLESDPQGAVSAESSPLAEPSRAARDFGLKVCGAGD